MIYAVVPTIIRKVQQGIMSKNVASVTNHSSQSHVYKHQHKDGRPEWRDGEHGNGRWVDDEGESHACRKVYQNTE